MVSSQILLSLLNSDKGELMQGARQPGGRRVTSVDSMRPQEAQVTTVLGMLLAEMYNYRNTSNQ